MTPLALLLVLAFLVSVSLGVTAGSAGLAMTSYALAYGSGQLVYGPLSDHFGRIAVVASVRFGRA